MKRKLTMLFIIGGLLFGLVYVLYAAISSRNYEVVQTDLFTYARKNRTVEIWSYNWDGSEDGLVIEIPDTLDGRTVTSLGGVGGSSTAPFYIESEALYPEYKEKIEAYYKGEIELENEEAEVGGMIANFADQVDSWTGEIVYLDFTLKIGPSIKSIYSIGDDADRIVVAGEDIVLVNRVYVECDPANKNFYSENGILYKKNGDKVEDFWYQE